MDYIECNYIKIEQPIGIFYIAAINWQDIIDIAYADIRRIETKEKREVETYLGIQRELSPGRVKEIGNYVNLIDATFPTSIILAVDQKDIEITNNILRIKRHENAAKIIDGQHRIEGLKKGYSQKDTPFQLNVTIFVEMEIEDQAIVFATINKVQTKVNKSLVYDLFEFAKLRSPQKTCHNIARLLNQEADSPFKDKIKILGKADDKEKETITQSTFVENLMQYISKKPMLDRDIIKRGERPESATEETINNLFFRNLFLDKQDAVIAKNIFNYFSAVKKKWAKAWTEVRQGNILNRSTGFIALMRFLKPTYLSFDRIGDVITEAEFFEIFDRIDINISDFTPDNYKPGQSGQVKLYKELLEKSGLK